MPFTTYGRNYMLDSLTVSRSAQTLYAALHSAQPVEGGASNEISGGSPAYARKAVSLAAASSGSRTDTADPVFDVPAGTTVSHVGYYDAASGGNLVAYADVTDETFGAQGTYTLTAQTLSLT
jgi:hypothetical protein